MIIDRGKVIKGLNCCCGTGMCFHGCPYHDASKKITECTSQLALGALDLLKEQGEQIKKRDESLEKARKEIKWLRGMLKEQEARTGKWIPVTNGRGWMECSICHDYAPSYPNGAEYLSKFCQNCGAKMESR